MNFRRNINYILSLTIAVAFLSISVFGVFGMMNMDHRGVDSMSTCPFMIGETALCTMNVFDHVASWQAMTASLPVGLLTLVFLIASLVMTGTWLRYLFGPPNTQQARILFPRSHKTHIPSFALLFLAGALNPRAP
ncbi:MAG: hypothetical protein A2937_02110 [Candidatus Yonathbacteria bacterium RIFCSPLOWO2_01_FULL_47_33b]|uniref:Uncharacterized protein n=1 Tax=Candidatus Yonathbacteria bacterium RIFCSPLOWO2_01_FULL_47_33b TaxID=1802727 RepID=A0A1G2SHT0_9BACT|nr:MAG: hypothetical protein A2937_02110 [Candidatus Yonathbacteria bacterium RIFCSPLOWO2_01_FULL_47_33b]